MRFMWRNRSIHVLSSKGLIMETLENLLTQYDVAIDKHYRMCGYSNSHGSGSVAPIKDIYEQKVKIAQLRESILNYGDKSS